MLYLDINMLVLLAEVTLIQIVVNCIIVAVLFKHHNRITRLAENFIALLEDTKG